MYPKSKCMTPTRDPKHNESVILYDGSWSRNQREGIVEEESWSKNQ